MPPVDKISRMRRSYFSRREWWHPGQRWGGKDGQMMIEVLKLHIAHSMLANRALVFMFAICALASCAKSEIISAQEQFDSNPDSMFGVKGILVHNPSAVIGNAEKHFKTPWMIVSPDAQKGFANGFTSNAVSVVSEDGVNYYAHQQDENGGRTNVIHFTVNEDGIPSQHGDVIDTTKSGEENNAEKMRKRKLVGVNRGTLYFYPCEEYGTSLGYNPENGRVFSDMVINKYTHEDELEQQKFLAVHNTGYTLNILVNAKYTDSYGEIQTKTYKKTTRVGDIPGKEDNFSAFPEDRQNMTVFLGTVYTGDSAGKVYEEENPVAALPGAISGLSENGKEVFATTKATNAFYNVTLGQYNVVKDRNGNPKPMVPQTRDGLVRVIDNRKFGGKFLYVTSKSVHTIDD